MNDTFDSRLIEFRHKFNRLIRDAEFDQIPTPYIIGIMHEAEAKMLLTKRL